MKTRLAKAIGPVAAVGLSRHLTASLLREMGRDPRFRTVLAITPDGVRQRGVERIPQGRGDLGERMLRLLKTFQPSPVILIGTDIPFVTREIIARAFQKLRGADGVFGAAEDGGYWLVGLGRQALKAAPFKAVRWSGPHALADTVQNLRALRIAFVDTLFDIDTEADYRRYRRALKGFPAGRTEVRPEKCEAVFR